MNRQDAVAEAFDYVIVGAGSAGCVLANRLTESGRYRVLLLEAGPGDGSLWHRLPLGYGRTLYDERYARHFLTEPEPHMDGRKLMWPRGRMLGGSSSVNGLIFIRGQARDYDHWASLGNPGWGWADVLPYFRKLEHNSRGASALHGGDGPLWCSDIRDRYPFFEALFDAAGEQGIPRNGDFNGPEQEGAGYYQFFVRNGFRCSTAVAYLRPAMKRPGLRVLTEAMSTRVLTENGRATGIEYRHGGRTHVATARREVILAAGSLQSPQLLMLSGIGPRAHLESVGVAPVHDLPGVGENLQDHLNVRSVYRLSQRVTLNDSLGSLAGRIGLAARYVLGRRGPLSHSAAPAGIFARVLPESEGPDVQFHLLALSTRGALNQPHDFPGCTFSVCQLRPESRGRITLRSTDAAEAPVIQANYLATEHDRRCLLAGIKLSRRIALSPALGAFVESEMLPGAQAQSDDDLMAFARDNGATIYHPTGTCKMGDDAMAVVDSRLRVHGLASLRVVDCSVMPTLVSGNTNAPTVMIAEKASDMILDDARVS
ncbi:MAG: choline dehydrogenase [Burkholderiaceae bacterium]